MFFFFFFQAEDGIRDVAVTGVQTCALPISSIKGTEVIAALRDRTTPPKVLVLTAYNDGESLRSALDAGAEGLALKTESPQQTLTAIRQVHAGQLVFPQAARRWIEGRASAPGDLTPRERE